MIKSAEFDCCALTAREEMMPGISVDRRWGWYADCSGGMEAEAMEVSLAQVAVWNSL